jgi:hypothetical protein
VARWFAVLFLPVTIGSVITAIEFWKEPPAPAVSANERREPDVIDPEARAVNSMRSTQAELVTTSPLASGFWN